MTNPSGPANPVISLDAASQHEISAERHVETMGGTILKKDGRVFVRLKGVASVGDVSVPYALVPSNGILANASKWRNMTPGNQLLVVMQRVNTKAVDVLRTQVNTFLTTFLPEVAANGLEAAQFLLILTEDASSDPVEVVLEGVRKRFANTVRATHDARAAKLTRDSINLSEYPDSFAVARSIPRKFIMLCGKTNSGKTHDAIQALIAAKTGVYLAPLRLLALENYERLTEAFAGTDRKVSLVTGEERRLEEGATHVASTVEMLDTRTIVDVAVIDEIQMLGDKDRGSAWTAAVCGAPAPVVYLVGALEARPAVEALAARLGIPLEVRVLERKSPLTVQAEPIKKVRNLKKGDAVICFSRRDVLAWRDLVTEAGLTACVVYGNLAPETRRAQVARFRDGTADVVVGTDSLAMGLNLSISRVVFSCSDKFNGVEEEELEAALAQQIGGRAGRYGMHEEGFVAGYDDATHRTIRSLMQEKVPMLAARGFYVSPTLEHLVRISDATGVTSLGALLKQFVRNVDVADGFFIPRITEDQAERALWLDTLPLSLDAKFTLSLVPISSRIPSLQGAWEQWTKNYSKDVPTVLRAAVYAYGERLQDAEDTCKMYSAYAWLGYRCPDLFPSGELALKEMRATSMRVDQILESQNKARRASGAAGAVPSRNPSAAQKSKPRQMQRGQGSRRAA